MAAPRERRMVLRGWDARRKPLRGYGGQTAP